MTPRGISLYITHTDIGQPQASVGIVGRNPAGTTCRATHISTLGFAVLLMAAGECKLGMLQLLLDRGADVNHREGKGTALDHAQLMGHDECITLLKSKGGKRGKDL